MTLNPFLLIRDCWLALAILWTVGLLFNKPTVRSQTPGTRAFHILLAALGFALLGSRWFEVGWMAQPFLAHSPLIHKVSEAAGVALVFAGCAFAAWARIALGANWSGTVTVKASHELVTEGPYAVARHPIYTGILAAVIGTALVVGEWRAVIGTIVIFLAFAAKISQEERLMLQQFPQAYSHYRQRVRALIPGIF